MNHAMKTCRMTVFLPARRRSYVIRWKDPRTGQKHEKSAKTTSRRDAYAAAADLAEQILAGMDGSDLFWEDFCTMYEDQIEAQRHGRGREPWEATKRKIKDLAPIRRLSEVCPAWIAKLQRALRKKKLSENTVGSHSARLKIVLRWAHQQGYLAAVPPIPVPVVDVPRSRSMTLEEFERVLEKVKVHRPQDWEAWDRLLRGQWACGFRISEMLAMSWDASAAVYLDYSGPYPLVRMAATGNKSRKLRVRPLTPEFWAIASETPEKNRSGLVFPILNCDGELMSRKRVVKLISKFGDKANVVTNPETGKKATSHDMRRSFIGGLDGKLTLAEIQKWTGHADIRTILSYYHTRDAEDLAKKLWADQPSPRQ